MNKRSKKAISIIVLVVLLISMSAGCAGKEEKKPEIIGTWKVCKVEASGVSIDFNQFMKQTGQDSDKVKMEMVANEDKTFAMDMAGQKMEGTWVEKNETYVLTVDGEDQEAKIEEGQLIFEEKTANLKLTLEKK